MAERVIETVESPVVENRDVGAGYRLMRLVAGEVAARARPGQFLTLGLVGVTDPLLPRPFAFFDIDRDSGEVHVLFKTVGRGTEALAGLREGERVRVIGPLGRGWRAPEEGTAVLVAGGTAYAALHFLAKALAAEGRPVRAIWGHSCKACLPDIAKVSAEGVELSLATDDGSCGLRGNAVECLRGLMAKELADRKCALFGAGPVPMLEALVAFAREKELPLQVSLEARMACGIGVCRGCVVNAAAPHPETGLRRRAVCTDGPVFDAAEIDWEDLW